MLQTTNYDLYVDLDGTLIRSDTLWDSVAILLGQQPLMVLLLPYWLLRGKSYFKTAVANCVIPQVNLLPYRQPVIDYLKQQHSQGRRIVLATAAEERIARAVAAHLACFHNILASTPERNLKGIAKLSAIKADAAGRPFVYAGDHHVDLPIWQSSGGAILVGQGRRFAPHLIGIPIEAILDYPPKIIVPLLKVLRPHQWVKNTLVFLPLMTAHCFFIPSALIPAAMLFVAFSLCASAVYVINDLLDLDHDRAHPRKCRRPFAAGMLPVTWGIFLAPILFFLSLGIALAISWSALGMLILYTCITTIYSFFLKRKLLIDVFTLAGLYTLRAVAGNVAAELPLSPWLMAFLVFLFLSLAFCKRYAELDQVVRRNDVNMSGRGYRAEDLLPIGIFGIGSAFVSSLVLGLYVTGGTVSALYGSPAVLWLAAPVSLYWLCRIWIVSWRGGMHDDPIIFAAKDRLTYFVGIALLVLIFLAKPKGI